MNNISISDIIDVIQSVDKIKSIIKQLTLSISYRFRYASYSFFYPQSIIKRLLAQNFGKPLKNARFIDYSLAIRNGYYGEPDNFSIRINNEILNKAIPYKTLINYMDSDNDRRILIKDFNLPRYDTPDNIVKITQYNLEEFLQAKPQTYNGRLLRMKSLLETSANQYECELQDIDYYYEVRSCLTIDIPLSCENEDTIRTMDLSADRSLKEFKDSILANAIGVSAVWYTSYNSQNKGDRKQFFLKVRNKKTAIFYDELGTVSGNVEPPKESSLEGVAYLEEYVEAHMLKEFYQETGYGDYMKCKGLTDKVVKIKLLSFNREFARGGKPQFFFIIMTPHISDSDLKQYFQKSIDGREEFNDSFVSNIAMHSLSPETEANYLYALSYLQRNQHLDFIDLD